MMKAIFMFALIAVCTCPGGYSTKPVNEYTIETALGVLHAANDGSNSAVALIAAANPELVVYATQLVAGLNHGMVYKVMDSQAQFACVKVFESLSGEFSVSASDYAETVEEAAKLCNIPYRPSVVSK